MRKPGLTGKPGREKRSRGRTHRGSRPAGRRRPAAVAAVGLLVAVLGGVLLFGTHDAGPVKRGSELQVSEPLDRSEPPAPATSEPDPAAALADLSRVRERLFRTLDAGLMPALSVEGSPARRADENMVARLREEGATLKGLSVEVDGARTLERSGDGAVARVRASAGASAYREVTSSGSTVRPAAEPAPLDFELHRVGGRWLVYAVYPASA